MVGQGFRAGTTGDKRPGGRGEGQDTGCLEVAGFSSVFGFYG